MAEGAYSVAGACFAVADPALRPALAQAYAAGIRPRCMCTAPGIEMYIARHRSFIVKRMPGTGPQHHPSCDSFEPDASHSGRGSLLGRAIVPADGELIELRVNFPLARAAGRAPSATPGQTKADVSAPAPLMSLQALLQFLFEQAGFNRWSPAMAGRRHQSVIRKYLVEAASDIRVKGKVLADRLYVPEAFDEAAKEQIGARRRARLSVLHPTECGGYEMALVIGEFKDATDASGTVRIQIRHMVDAPMSMDANAWQRLRRKFSWMFDLAASEVGDQVRIVLCLLVYAKQEHVLNVDTATCMLSSKNWIPLDAAFELELAGRLTEEGRRFLKPLRYDAKPSESFPNFLLLDTGNVPTPMYVLSGFMSKEAFVAKEKAIERAGTASWVWRTCEPMPPFPMTVVAKPGAGAG